MKNVKTIFRGQRVDQHNLLTMIISIIIIMKLLMACRNQALPIVAVCCKQSPTYPLKLTSLNKEPTYSAVKGVCSAGLTTTTLPQARAAESFKHAILRGKFHGTIAPTTPTGSCLVYTK